MSDGRKRTRKTPQEKKRLSYDKDSIRIAEYPHTLRKSLPKKKAKANRSDRRKINHSLGDVAEEANSATACDADLEPAFVPPPNQVGSWGATTLKESVEGRLHGRKRRVAWKFFKKGYQSEVHREAFASFLGEMIEGHSVESAGLAEVYFILLDPDELDARSDAEIEEITGLSHYECGRRCYWLRKFLDDEPQWEQALREWIASFG